MTRSETHDPGSRVPLSVIIPTRDEERNLGQTLATVVNWADQIIVFDSFSNDRTLEIARGFGAEIAQRAFDNFASHKNWALDNLPVRNQWILVSGCGRASRSDVTRRDRRRCLQNSRSQRILHLTAELLHGAMDSARGHVPGLAVAADSTREGALRRPHRARTYCRRGRHRIFEKPDGTP